MIKELIPSNIRNKTALKENSLSNLGKDRDTTFCLGASPDKQVKNSYILQKNSILLFILLHEDCVLLT